MHLSGDVSLVKLGMSEEEYVYLSSEVRRNRLLLCLRFFFLRLVEQMLQYFTSNPSNHKEQLTARYGNIETKLTCQSK